MTAMPQDRLRTLRLHIIVAMDDPDVTTVVEGHPVGDALLVQVASRLRTCVGDAGMVARLGGWRRGRRSA